MYLLVVLIMVGGMVWRLFVPRLLETAPDGGTV